MISYAPIPDTIEKCAKACVDAAMTVHKNLGPGFKHPIYQRAFCLELDSRGIKFESEKPTPRSGRSITRRSSRT